MKAATATVSLFSLLAGATAFVPVAPIGRNAGSTLPASSSHVRGKPLSMGFDSDFKSTMEKISDTRYARVRHILVDEKGEEGRARLEEVKAEIDGDLDKFSEVAERMSTCTSASEGGRLRLLGRGETEPAFDEVAFNGEYGIVHGPVNTDFGTHLIWVESCDKPEKLWKELFEDIGKKVFGKEDDGK